MSKDNSEKKENSSLGFWNGVKFDKRRLGLVIQVVAFSVIPVLIMGFVFTFNGRDTVWETMNTEVEFELKSAAITIESAYDLLGRGDFVQLKSGNVIKGGVILNNNYRMVDPLADEGKVFSATFFSDKAVVSSFRDLEGRRLSDIPMPEEVKSDVLKAGLEKYVSGLEVGGSRYFAYYRPLYGEDETIIGAILTAMDETFVNESVNAIVYRMSFITGLGILLALLLALILVFSISRFLRQIVKEEAEMDEIAKANLAKESFLANMSHEIRTPINAVLGMDEMIIRESKEEPIKDYARKIRTAGKNLLELVDDIFDLSKVQSGKVELIDVRYEVSAVISETYSQLKKKAIEKDLDFTVENDPTIPSELSGDESRIKQIFMNLMSNAVKYTEEGGVRVIFGYERQDEENIILVMSVEDTGMGIKESDIPLLFETFKRFDEARKKDGEGTGLGLPITKSLVELMGGTISVKSTYGKGSTFTVRIPQKVMSKIPMGDYSDAIANIEMRSTARTESFVAPDASILIVEDMKVNRDVLEGLLKHTKIQVDLAASGGACLEAVMHRQYDLILMDHMMPEMDGVETLWMLKKTADNLSKNARVVALTANVAVGAKEQYLEWGFDDYLSKPVQIGALEACLLKHLPPDKIIFQAADEEEHEEVKEEKKTEETRYVPNVFDTDNETVKTETSKKKPEYAKRPLLEELADFLDTDTGLQYCLDEETYKGILETYVEEDRGPDILKFFREEKWDDYRVLVHAVKSTSLYIGAVPLSEKAKTLETACIQGDTDYIKGNHEEMYEEYEDLLGKIENVLQS